MVGLEALSMQGLPIDKLLLTRETEDQLADLAGNAMSTTVVGTCMVAALIVGRKLLREGSDKESYEQKAGNAEGTAPNDDTMDIDQIGSVHIETGRQSCRGIQQIYHIMLSGGHVGAGCN